MKKILLPVMLGLLCMPANADQNLRDFVGELGYRSDFIMDNLPKEKAKQSLQPAQSKSHSFAVQRPLLQASDLLNPRVLIKSEAPDMIPVLLRLHRQNPASAKITRTLAATCLRHGQPREALYWYTQTWQRDRSDYESLWNMACLAHRLGDGDLTRKYLGEYASVDPTSAWGRMAREFLAGSYSGADLADGFKNSTPRFGSVESADSGSAQRVWQAERPPENVDASAGIMVIEGQRTTFDRFMSGFEQRESALGKKNDTLKGKTKEKKADTEAPAKQTALQNARIVEELKPAIVTADQAPASSENLAVTATAPPLVP